VTSPTKPTFATNRVDSGETVADAVNAFIHGIANKWSAPFTIAIATAYINPGGFGLLEEALHRAQSVRLLIGAEPEPPVARIRHLSDDEEDPASRAITSHDRLLNQDRDLLGFSQSADADARQFLDWLKSGVVQVRRYENGFLHGKAYLIDTDDTGVIAGSSNFTRAGLAYNHELNLGQYDPHTVAEVRSWFDEMWSGAVDYDLAAVYEARFLPHSPYLIYLRMLWEKYGADVMALAEADQFGLHLATFQKDGVTMAKMILDRYRGVVIADGVGLGKTFVAGELIREAVEERRQRVLVVAPAALRDGPWRSFRANQLFSFEVVSFDQLAADPQLNPMNPGGNAALQHPINEYAMVVVDEAHAYRNPATLRAEALGRMLEGSPPKDLVLLTATPVNNSLWDLYNLLAYFVRNDATFAAVGIPSLRDKFKQAAATDPEALDPDHLFDVLSPVVVRRTRSYVKHYYPGEELLVNGVKQRITFPAPEVLAVTYDLGTVLPGFLERFAAALDVQPSEQDEEDARSPILAASARRAEGQAALTLARYAPSAYRIDEQFEAYEGQVSGLLRSGLLKRFESSAAAFASTCRTMADSHDDFLAQVDAGHVATGAALRELSASDSDDVDALIAANEDWKVAPAADYDCDRLRADVEADRDLLREWAAVADGVVRDKDPKLSALIDQLGEIADGAVADVMERSSEADRRKVIVFSYFADTVDWIKGHLDAVVDSDPRLAAYRGRITSVNGSDHENSQRAALFGFAPLTTEAPPPAADLFDIMVTTDVLAEGVNLQQARHIINYDLPWNPMRLVQRHGRIDRIGSPHSRVWLRCFMPDRELDALLRLEERLHSKIRQAARSIGVEATIIPGSEVSDRTYSETSEVIAEIRRGETGFLDEAVGGRSVEEYRQQLREGIQNPFLFGQVKELAWGSGSGKAVAGADPGFVFCARVGDSKDPQFRYVNVADPNNPIVISDVLASLRHAAAQESTTRVLDEAMYSRAYNAWLDARGSIYDAWMYATDLRNLQAEIPKAMREAADHVIAHPPIGVDQDGVDRLVDTLRAPYPERIRKQVRDILGSGDSAEGKSAALAQMVARLALTPPPDPKPLPLIDEDDIHLVCWMAITPA
jgi:hypothetical protein